MTQSVSAPTSAPELLAPAGDWEALRAAAANGADAVYFGVHGFNARHRAANFSLDELPEVMSYLHAHNVRGYIALNVLIFSAELPDAARLIRGIAAAGADAIIVQDLGLAALASRICPDLPVHGSTQMTLTEPLGIEFVRALGAKRVILARELSLPDIRKITAATDLPVEVFIHGALCVSYSGQCLTSEALGGRSANRGQCAQACRLPYDLIVDAKPFDLGEKSYLLSPQDLAAHDLIDQLTEAGVCSFKIEGRLKSAQYVAATTQTYRQAIDSAARHVPFAATRQQQLDLSHSFSRGFTHGFLDGVDHQKLVHARFPKSRGIRAGQVTGKTSTGILARPAPGILLKAGDGIVFDEGHPEQDEQGGRIFQINRRGDTLELIFRQGDVSVPAVAPGSIVWKTDDPEIRRRLEHSYSRETVARRIEIQASVTAREGERLQITVTDDQGHEAQVEWDRPLERAQKFPATLQLFREQFGRLGDTPFTLGKVTINGQDSADFPPVMLPKSVLNDLRRQASAKLIEARERTKKYPIADPEALQHMRDEIPKASSFPLTPSPCTQGEGRPAVSAVEPGEGSSTVKLHILVRSMEQLEVALAFIPERISRGIIYCEFEDPRKYPAAVKLAHDANSKIGIATLRIIKPSEHGLLEQIAAANPDVVLIRNLAALSYFHTNHPNMPLVADYALNVANELTAAILAKHRVIRMTPSYDLTWPQMSAMFSHCPVDWFEAVIHQHMPMFHMEHCVFAHTLSNGKDFRDCGRPCETHMVTLRDRAGVEHPLIADVGCRNTVFNGTRQSAAEFLPRMQEAGLRNFRIELLKEDAAATTELLNRYAKVLAGDETPKAAWRQLKILSQIGVTRGTME